MGKFYGDEKTAIDQWRKLKGAGFKAHAQYIYQYYGLIIFIAICVIVSAFYLIKTIVYNSVPDVVQGDFFVSGYEDGKDEDLKLILCEKMGLDPEEYHISISTSAGMGADSEYAYVATMKMTARVSAHDLDFVISNKGGIDYYMDTDEEGSSAFVDLHEVMDDETLAEFEAAGKVAYYDSQYLGSYPYMIEVNDSELLEILGTEPYETLYIAFVIGAPHPEAFPALLDLLK